MIEVAPGMFVGDDGDAAAVGTAPGWFIVHAAKEPYHRAALGYTTMGAPKHDPEYLVAHRPGCVVLNLVDVPQPDLIHPAVIAAAIDAIGAALADDCKVLVHCNQGRSRSPTIAFLYLSLRTDQFDALTYDQAAEAFRAIYPPFAPAGGMAGYAQQAWKGEIPEHASAMPVVEPEPAKVSTPRPATRAIFTL